MHGTRTVALPCLFALLSSSYLALADEESPFSATATRTPELDLVADASTPEAEVEQDDIAQDDARTVLAEVPDIESQITLDEAIQLALRNNLDIEIARTVPAVAETAIKQAEGAFDPVGNARYIFSHGEEPTANSLNSADNIASDNWDYGGGISGILPFGLQYSTTTGVDRQETNQTIALLDRRFVARWNADVMLPLMRDFRVNQANMTLRRTRLSRDMSVDDFRTQLTQIVATVEDLYWDLAARRAAVNVATKSLKTAKDLLEQTIVQEEVGVVSRVAVVQARAGVAEREVNLIRAENAKENAHDLLLDALLAPSAAVFEDRELIPRPPQFADYPVDLAVSIQRALQNRPEIEKQKTAVEMAEMEVDLADNQAKPRVDLVASYGTAGQAGRIDQNSVQNAALRSFDRNNLGQPVDEMGNPLSQAQIDAATSALVSSIPIKKNGRDSFDDFFRAGGERSFSAGVQVEVPFFNRTGKGAASQRRIEARRARANVRKQEQLVVREVRQAVRSVESAAKSVRATERRRAAAMESLRAEQERLRLGDSTPFQVLEFDSDLAEAEGQVIEALRGYENAITALERVQGTLLEKRRIEIDDELDR